MKTFNIRYDKVFSLTVRARTATAAMKIACRKLLYFDISEVFFNEFGIRIESDSIRYINYNGKIEQIKIK